MPEALLETPAPAALSPSQRTEQRVVQGVVCGAWAVAFELGWARAIVENFELVAVPLANPWLVGATNIEGEILPVVDLAAVIAPSDKPFLRQTGHRLLVCGSGADAMAFVFERRPQMLRFDPRDGQQLAHVPQSIREFARGLASNARGEAYIELDGPKLIAHLASLSA